MVFWYRNSILASIVSIIGCALVLVSIEGITSGEATAAEGAIMIIVGVVLAALGKVISVKKAEKQSGKGN